MRLPVIAIVGRPNVGKSAFFNAVVGSRISIVDPTAGVTRDRVSTEVEHNNRRFELFDTGGIGLFDEALLKEEIEHQIEIAIHSADGVIFMVDIRDGLTPLDRHVGKKLRALKKPILLVANKADTLRLENERHQFYPLGFGEPLAISATEGRSVFETIETILEKVPVYEEEKEDHLIIPRVAIVGKMNAGKSTLVNHLAKEERVIVSEIPGTTRDSVDVRVQIEGNKFIVIDTAGLRRKKSIQDSIEFYGQARAAKAIRRADVVLFLKDVSQEVTAVDKTIAALIEEHCKPCILAMTKWDLADQLEEPIDPEEYGPYLADTLPGMRVAPLTFISSFTGFNIKETFALVPELWKQAGERISTGTLNRALQDAITQRSAGTRKSKVAKVYYGAQVSVHPPTFTVFVNDVRLFSDQYKRYLVHFFQDRFPFSEVPIRIFFKGKKKEG